MLIKEIYIERRGECVVCVCRCATGRVLHVYHSLLPAAAINFRTEDSSLTAITFVVGLKF
jgi:hypothetical protein